MFLVLMKDAIELWLCEAEKPTELLALVSSQTAQELKDEKNQER